MSQATRRPFTSRTYVSLALARGIAAANGHADLTGSHIALGLLREGANPAVAAIDLAGIPLRMLQLELESTLPERGRPNFAEVVLPTTSGERQVVDAAASEAETLGSDYLGNEHLLLALLHDEASPAAQVFVRYGFTYETALDHLRAVFAGKVINIMERLRQEYLRVCPGDEPDTFLQMVAVTPRQVLKELRRLPDAAGQTAIASAFRDASKHSAAGV